MDINWKSKDVCHYLYLQFYLLTELKKIEDTPFSSIEAYFESYQGEFFRYWIARNKHLNSSVVVSENSSLTEVLGHILYLNGIMVYNSKGLVKGYIFEQGNGYFQQKLEPIFSFLLHSVDTCIKKEYLEHLSLLISGILLIIRTFYS